MKPTIIYTKTDEAPYLATFSLLPILKAFTHAADIDLQLYDISLAGRILAVFPEYIAPEQRIPDALTELGQMVKSPEAAIIKLPNISASLPQLEAAIRELQAAGYAVPDYPAQADGAEQQDIKARYDKVKGSAVNPVLREGNSDRRCAAAVKEYARKHPHRMGPWSSDSASHVASMKHGDFYESECSLLLETDTEAKIVFFGNDGTETLLKDALKLSASEILDTAVMSSRALKEFFRAQIADALEKDVLFSLHLKATMMKVSDPIIFGYCVQEFLKEVFDNYGDLLAGVGVNPDNGLADMLSRIDNLAPEDKAGVAAAIKACLESRPPLAMVDSDRGISNLHVPSDVIIDASMPAAIRASGQMWGPDGRQKDTKFIIPDRSYAGVYAATVKHCKQHGAFDPATMGSVSNVGLMARKAEEYGSHDKTFKAPGDGVVRVVDPGGRTLLEQKVEQGDIFRGCQVKDAAVRDWVSLAVRRARASGVPAVFWLDQNRAHDRLLISRVEIFLRDEDCDGLEIYVMSPVEACLYSLDRLRKGLDTISVTGNVLRDYLTDLFPILELGTSAKMLSIVPLMNGGGLFETGAGGSAPKHVQQFVKEGHLRWDSLGEFLAFAVTLEHIAEQTGNTRAALLAETMDRATARVLNDRKSPSRKVHEIDNRGSHFYLALYWAEELAAQDEDRELQEFFLSISRKMRDNEEQIVGELDAAQGKPVNIGGYYFPDESLVTAVMQPSASFNEILRDVITSC